MSAVSLRPAAVLARASSLVLLVAFAGCAERQALPNDPVGRLFARGLDEITDLYISPGLQPAARSRGRCAVLAARRQVFGHRNSGAETGRRSCSSYGGREVAVYPVPSQDDPHDWGALDGPSGGRRKGGIADASRRCRKTRSTRRCSTASPAALDRFSRYSSPEVARDQRAIRDGFGGIGVTLDASNEEFRITAVTPRGPAELAGIRPDDRLVAIDKVPTAGRSQSDVVHALRGPILSPVEVTVYRPSLGQNRTYRLQRELVILPTVSVSRDGGIVGPSGGELQPEHDAADRRGARMP